MPHYEQHPVVQIDGDAGLCLQGWSEVAAELRDFLRQRSQVAAGAQVVVVEVYPGIDAGALAKNLCAVLGSCSSFLSEEAFLQPEQLRVIFAETLSEDPVFNVMRPWTMKTYFGLDKLERLRAAAGAESGTVLIVGPGASYVYEGADLLISANVSRWEIQQRQRAHAIGNMGFSNAEAAPGELYKNAFFLDWRVADRVRHDIFKRVHFFLDMNEEANPRLLSGDVLRAAVRKTVQQPFRVVPFFDPGPWGGQWMRQQFNLPDGPKNYAWGFDCVPEENSVLLGFGERYFNLPAIVLVHEEPELLLGSSILARFGAEFPIRFDFLDTVQGGNLSLQVHPSKAYIRDHFGMPYTQDESYYMLHCEPHSSMYLGLREEAEREAMSEALYKANEGGDAFPADQFVARWPTRTHDHFSIPAGTVHCSGAGNVVLEISATPYIFTFKLWDWGRTGLDGRPRPIHLEHGLANIRWERSTEWTRRELVDQVMIINEGDGWREERTGLHATQFLETRRHWFSKPVTHDTGGNLQVVNLVNGDQVVVSSPSGAFEPLIIHYAETFIVPACVGAYTIAPIELDGRTLATLKAYVRT